MNSLRSAATTLLLVALSATAAAGQGLFHPDDVERMKAFTTANAGYKLYKHFDCLETVNRAMRALFNEPRLRLGSTVDLTMQALQRIDRGSDTQQFDFLDENGRKTSGVTAPKVLQRSLWDGLLEMVGGAKGYSIFGVSPLDGNHSVLLVVDTRNAEPTMFWADQWSTKKGWKEYPTKSSLDGEIERLTSKWWVSKLSEKGIKFKSRCRIYPLIPKAEADRTQPTAQLTRVTSLRMRTGPGTDHDQVEGEGGAKRYFSKNQDYPIVQREGRWARLHLPDGTYAWGHMGYMRVIDVPAVIVTAGAASALDRAGPGSRE